ncbi:MAG: hypothetical protein AAF658_11075, partial [Myxococcota bacterium]
MSVELPILAAVVLIESFTGIRLILIATETREPAELCLGITFLSAVLLNGTSLVFSLLYDGPTLVSVITFVVAYWILSTSMVVGFWQVFRGYSRVTRAITVILAVGLAILGVLAVLDFPSDEALKFYRLIQAAVSIGLFTWAAIESGMRAQKLRRQLKFGLTNIFVVHRFVLWTAAGVIWASFYGAMLLARYIEFPGSTLSWFTLATALIGSLLVYLTF